MEELTPVQKLGRCKKRLTYLEQTLRDNDELLSSIIRKAIEDELMTVPVKSEYGQDIMEVMVKLIALSKDVNLIL